MALGGLNGSMGIMARREQTITEVTIDDVEIRVGDGRDVLRRPNPMPANRLFGKRICNGTEKGICGT